LPSPGCPWADETEPETGPPDPTQANQTQAAVGRPLSLLPPVATSQRAAPTREVPDTRAGAEGRRGVRPPPHPPPPRCYSKPLWSNMLPLVPRRVLQEGRADEREAQTRTHTHTHPRGPRREAGLKLVPLSFRPDPGPCLRPPRVTVWGPPRPPDTPLDTVASSALEASQDPRPTRARFKHDPNTISSRPETYPRGSRHQHAMLRNACSHRPCASQRPPSGPDT